MTNEHLFDIFIFIVALAEGVVIFLCKKIINRQEKGYNEFAKHLELLENENERLKSKIKKMKSTEMTLERIVK